MLATLFIVVGNGFLVAFGNHESRSKSCISLPPKFLLVELSSMWRISCVSSILVTSLFYCLLHKMICPSMCWFFRLHTWKTLGKLHGNCICCLLHDPAHSGCWSSCCVQVSIDVVSKIEIFCVSGLIYACSSSLVLFMFFSCLTSLPTFTRRGRQLAAIRGEDPVGAWRMLLPYTYAVVSGAIGSHSVLFAKSM